MDEFKAYRDRVTAISYSSQDDLITSTKRQAHASMMDSPTLSYVTLNDEENTCPSIVSDMETFNKRRFLFLPDSVTNVGDYVIHKDMTYLAIDAVKSEIYPELIGELCNQTFRLLKSTTKVLIGKDEFGRPIYDNVEDVVYLPCVMTDQVYSALSNQPIPLPTGAMIMKIPYDSDYKVTINYGIKIRDSEYKTTEVSYEHVVNEIGYIEVYLQREVNKLGN